MRRRKLGRGALLVLLIISAARANTAALQLSQQHGDSLQHKIDEVTRNAAKNPVARKKTPVSDLEVNSYLTYNSKDRIPRGLTQPQITMLGEGQLAGRVIVDLDEFKRQRKPQGFMDPLSYLSGRVPLTARGALRTRDGRGRFYFGSAEIFGVPVPEPIVQELVSYFSRTPENPRGFDMNAPFDLPARIREIRVNRGESILEQ
jgi:hypothetical protein